MRIPKIFTEQTISPGCTFTLDGQAAQHIAKVLRMKAGDKVCLFNNDGNFYHADIIHLDKKSVDLTIEYSEPANTESPLLTHLGQVISRGDRMDYAIQKSTECGVNIITPLLSERCEVKLSGDRMQKRVQHWQQVAISAAEQCGRAKVPVIQPVIPLSQWLGEKHGLGLVLHHRDTQQLTTISPAPASVSLLIGPEGGLTQAEITASQDAGFLATTIGPRVFRTETAAVSALSIVQWLWGDLQTRDA